MKIFRIIICACLILVFFMKIDTSEGGIQETRHNLSVTGPGPIKSTVEDRICIFCHSPERARGKRALWNRRDSKRHYVTYESSTTKANIGQPTGASKLCLSCHDGTIALGSLYSERREIPFEGGIRYLPEGRTLIGTDLSDDHPVSFNYDKDLTLRNTEIENPDILLKVVRLEKGKELQCTTCHDPHNDMYGKFLVMPNKFSELCTVCHRKTEWSSTSHATSDAQWNSLGEDPWPHSSYETVAENGCENCHTSHAAGGHERLMNYFYEEDNCLVCHSGNVAGANIEKEIVKPYRHSVQDYSGVHDPVEDFLSKKIDKHVECSDCHNPHSSNADKSAGAPMISGATAGVKGIDVSGVPVLPAVKQFEICFKCHADNDFVGEILIDRSIQEYNTRLEFAPSNPSYHPVISRGENLDVPSLFEGYTVESIIFCTDCHNNNDTSGPRGPHGSSYKFLLAEKYEIEDFTEENPENYALCYKCHERESILNDESFRSHKVHVVDQNTPCSACHDAHGISLSMGNTTNNSNLINFDLTIVESDSQGRLLFEDTGLFSGRCFLKCHDSSHEPKSYE